MTESFADQLSYVKLMASERWSDLPRQSRERLRSVLADRERILNEVASVLMNLDEVAEIRFDEGVFRRCRDRLRKLVGEQS